MNEHREALANSVRELSRRLSHGGPDYLERAIICTPSMACYGEVSHWIICLQGSPPRGVFVVANDLRIPDQAVAFIDADARAKRLQYAQASLLLRFVEAHLAGLKTTIRVEAVE